MTEADVKKVVDEKLGSAVGFDPLTILMIISLIMSAIKIIQQCKAAKSVLKSSARRKGLAYRIFVKNNLLDPMVSNGLSKEQAEDIIESLRNEYINQE
jgi:hypothetical protein